MKTHQRKLLAVGEDGTGKASLLHTIYTGNFPESWRTVCSCSGDVKEVMLPGQRSKVELALWTAPGGSQYDNVRPLSYLDTRVVLLCYAVDRPDTFSVLTKVWVPEVRRHSRRGTPIILVGTKCDSRPPGENVEPVRGAEEVDNSQHGRFVTTNQGQILGDVIKAHAVMECSAKDGTNVQELITTAAEAAMLKSKRRKQRSDIEHCRIA